MTLLWGITCYKIVNMLYEAGAKSARKNCLSWNKISRFLWGRHANKEELLAFKKENQAMCEYIKAKTLKFLSLDGLYLFNKWKKKQ